MITMTMNRWERQAAHRQVEIKWQIYYATFSETSHKFNELSTHHHNDKSHIEDIESFVCCAYRSPT